MIELEPNTVVGDRYTLRRRLGMGGMGEVWEATVVGPAGFEKLVAIKMIRTILAREDSMVTMFLDEARLAARLTHPNIVQIQELGVFEDMYFIVMECVDGVDLAKLMKRMRARARLMGKAEALFVTSSLLSALDYAHTATDAEGKPLSVVHRDVSPQNILCAYRSGSVKLTDFGVARAAGQSHRTATGVVRGKLAYMAPEHLAGRRIDGRADLYAVGLILHELLTGEFIRVEDRLPVDQTQPDFDAIRAPGLPLVEEKHPELVELLRWALEPKAEDRVSSARAFLDALAPHLRDLPGADARLARFLDEVLPKGSPDPPELEGEELPVFLSAPSATMSGVTEPRTTPTPVGEVISTDSVDSGENRETIPQKLAPPAPARRRAASPIRWAFAGAIVFLLAFGVGLFLWSSEDEPKIVAAPEPPAPPVVQQLEPPPAPPNLEPEPEPEPTPTPTPTPDPPKRPRRERDKKPPRPAPAASPAPPPPARGFISVTCNERALVEIDGEVVGRTDLLRHAVSPGRHSVQVTCVYSWGRKAGPKRIVDVPADQHLRVSHECLLVKPE